MGVLLSQALPGQTPDRFSRWDRDGDGRLTPEELPGPLRANFNRVDRDGDGFISREEDGEMAARQAASAPRQARGDLPGGVRIVPDLPYASTENPRQTLDLLLPGASRTADNPLPIIVFIHGGGWKGGDKSAARQRLATLVAEGNYACAAVGYRLSGEAVWPAQIHDCKAALRWLRAHATENGIDPGKIAVYGISAGGHLVSLLGTTQNDPALEGEIGENAGTKTDVTCVLNFCGPGNLLEFGGKGSVIDPESSSGGVGKLLGGPVSQHKEAARAASPFHHVSKDDAPFLTIHGTKDELVPYVLAQELDEALEKAGVESILLTGEDGPHVFFSPELRDRMRSFLDRHLLGKGEGPKEGPVPIK